MGKKEKNKSKGDTNTTVGTSKKDKKGKHAASSSSPVALSTPEPLLAPLQEAPQLSSKLLGPAIEGAGDKELDAIFKHSAGAFKSPNPAATITGTHKEPSSLKGETTQKESPRNPKRKIENSTIDDDDQDSDGRAKRLKSAVVASQKKHVKFAISHDGISHPERQKQKKPTVQSRTRERPEEDTSDEDTHLADEAHNTGIPASSDGSSESDGESPSELVHESVKKSTKPKKSKRRKYAPEGETREERDARTVFIGNLPPQVIKSNSAVKSLYKHLLSSIPSSARAKIESHRFRSVAFSSATSEPLSKDSATTDANLDQPSTATPEPSKKHTRQQERAASWRTNDQTEETATKTFISSKEKKRISFIKGELNTNAQTVNCYVVFAHEPPNAQPSDLPPAMHPSDIAKVVAKAADGTVFMDRTIRVDVALKQGLDKTPAEKQEDMKTTIFVGNLDFAAKEEDLRVLFESLVTQERGPPGGTADDGDLSVGDDTDGADPSPEKQSKTWVQYVRVVRDKDTQVGKGFAYVQFSDRECVDEILALGEGTVKYAKRKLRIQRNKTLPGSTISIKKPKVEPKSQAKRPDWGGKSPKSQQSAMPMPKGDPGLGEKLKTLSKEERKAVKSSDADRVARRLAKKKLKGATGKTTSAPKSVKAKAILGKRGTSNPRPKLKARVKDDKPAKI